jgi:hypothetical protein
MRLRISLDFFKLFINKRVNIGEVYTVGPESREETALASPPPPLRSRGTRLVGSFFFACRRS